jgi:DUF1680 family protein
MNCTHNQIETPSGAYANEKLSRYLMAITGDSKYGDSLERMLSNGILAATHPRDDGSAFYYSDYHPLAHKTYHPDKWPCCSGTYPQVIADYLVSAYFHDGDGIYVNLYAPTELTWGDVTLTQTTDYPNADRVTCRVRLRGGHKTFPIHFRIPAWSQSPTISVAGETTSAKPGEFATLRRTWKDGDAIELTLPMTYRTEPIDEQHREVVALLRGPVVYVATPQDLKIPRAALNEDPAKHPIRAGDVKFVPFHAIGDEAYTMYFAQT